MLSELSKVSMLTWQFVRVDVNCIKWSFSNHEFMTKHL